ncbi:hypothetical protein C7S14_7489 [Burkholderia cepacia]|nr:hypothetical protein [Burkholderia cepacia]QOH35692.1 hypothetical protein C7S14_7489 [Burkholderia cepacia]
MPVVKINPTAIRIRHAELENGAVFARRNGFPRSRFAR